MFDNTKVRQYVPGFAPRRTFHAAAADLIGWRAEHPADTGPSAEVDAIMDRLADGHRRSREIYESLGAAALAARQNT